MNKHLIYYYIPNFQVTIDSFSEVYLKLQGNYNI